MSTPALSVFRISKTVHFPCKLYYARLREKREIFQGLIASDVSLGL